MWSDNQEILPDTPKSFITFSIISAVGLANKFLKGKNKPTKKDLDNEVKKTEIDELIDSDGGLLGARTPLYNMTLAPKKTMDQIEEQAKGYVYVFDKDKFIERLLKHKKISSQ